MSCITIFKDDDDGIPPGCHHPLCPLDHRNIYLNENDYVRKLGEFGYPYFDKNRKTFHGIASLVTIFALFITAWGSFALSTNPNIVQRTYWAGGHGKNLTSGQDFSVYIGLRSVEFVDCSFTPGYSDYSDICQRKSIKWDDNKCTEGLVGSACTSCEESAKKLWQTAFTSCFGLILSFLGTQTRMRSIADVPVQKMLGMGAETWNVISLSAALYIFHHSCYVQLNESFNEGAIHSVFWSGPGYICYVLCVVSALVRAIVHWLTPLPGHGSGFCFCFFKQSDRLRTISRAYPDDVTVTVPDVDIENNKQQQHKNEDNPEKGDILDTVTSSLHQHTDATPKS